MSCTHLRLLARGADRSLRARFSSFHALFAFVSRTPRQLLSRVSRAVSPGAGVIATLAATFLLRLRH
eukprot:6175721-Pleurochrysis_carterae.AAC.1